MAIDTWMRWLARRAHAGGPADWSWCGLKLGAQARFVARQASFPGRACRASRVASRRWCRAMPSTTPISSPPTTPPPRSPTGAAPPSSDCRASLRTSERADARPDGRSRASYLRPAVHRELPRALPVQPHREDAFARRVVPRLVERRAGHRSRRQRLLRSDRVVRREPARLRFLQGVHGARRPEGERARPGAGRLPVAGRRQRRAPGPDFRQAGDLVPHVGDGSGHAGRPAGPLSHAALPSRAFLRRLSRLVG